MSHLTLPELSANIIGAVITLALAVFFFIWRLVTLTHSKLNFQEHQLNATLLRQTPWWKSILQLNGPYYLLMHLSRLIGNNLYLFRMVSVLIGILSALAVYWLISQWHGYKIGMMSAAIYITSFGALAIVRQAGQISASMLITVGLLVAIALIYRWQNFWSLLLLILVVDSLLYLPGAIWLVIAALILSFGKIRESFSDLSAIEKLALTLLFLIFLVPIAFRLGYHYSNHQLVYWLGYALNGKLSALKSFGLNLVRTPANLFFYSLSLPAALSLGHLPLLPISITILSILGFYCYLTRMSNYRWRTISVLFLIGWLSVGLGVLSVYVLLPLCALAAGTGLAFMLKEWYTVFPKNPIARYLGVALMVLIIAFTCFFSARSYFVAWANDPATTSNYSYQLN